MPPCSHNLTVRMPSFLLASAQIATDLPNNCHAISTRLRDVATSNIIFNIQICIFLCRNGPAHCSVSCSLGCHLEKEKTWWMSVTEHAISKSENYIKWWTIPKCYRNISKTNVQICPINVKQTLLPNAKADSDMTNQSALFCSLNFAMQEVLNWFNIICRMS